MAKHTKHPLLYFLDSHTAHLRLWCQENNIDYEALTSDDINKFSDDALEMYNQMKTEAKRGIIAGGVPPIMTPEEYMNILLSFDPQMQVAAGIIAYQWRINKQVYSFDKEFIDILSETPLDIKLTESMFENVPFPVFAIEWGDNYGLVSIDQYHNQERKARMKGLIIVGLDKDQQSTSTICYDLSGNPDDAPPINEIIGNFNEENERYILTALTQATLYIAAENAIIKENEAQKKIYRPAKRGFIRDKYTEIRKWDCGIRHNELNLMRKTNETHYESTGSDGSHASPRTHWRRAHWHTYRVGKGRTKTKLKWVQPTLVNANNDIEEPTPMTITHVKTKK